MSPRTKRILDLLRFTAFTFQEIGEMEGVSYQRVSQHDSKYGIRRPKRKPLFSREEIHDIIRRHSDAIS